MVTILPREHDLGNAGRNFAQGVTSQYQNRHDDMAIQKAIADLGPNATPRERLDAITGAKTYSPERKQAALKTMIGVEQFEELKRAHKESEDIARGKNLIAESKLNQDQNKAYNERIATRDIVKSLGIADKEEEERLGNALTLSGAESLYKEKMKPTKDKEAKLSPFDKKLQSKYADDYIETNKEASKLRDTLKNIDYVEDLSKNLGYLGGLTNPVTGLLPTEKNKELEAASFPLIEPIVKMFNPSGPIATQKLKIIQDKYQIKATDFPWQIQGKLKALRNFGKQALARAEERLKIYQKYDGAPPKGTIEAFDRESETLGDAMADFNIAGEEASHPDLPSAKEYKDKTITSPEGQKFYSDGTRWLKK